jgi:hypothetical protein
MPGAVRSAGVLELLDEIIAGAVEPLVPMPRPSSSSEARKLRIVLASATFAGWVDAVNAAIGGFRRALRDRLGGRHGPACFVELQAVVATTKLSAAAK